MSSPADYMRKSGVILAAVTNIKDPENLNRLKCKPITADRDVAETDWCYCISPMAGNQYGQFFFPKVGDLVLLGYLGGDVHHPIVFGSYWANDVKPPYTIENGKNDIRAIRTPAGVEIRMEDTDKKETLTLTTPSGAVITVDDGEKTIAVQDKGSENHLTISWEKGEITLSAKKKLTLSAGDTSLVLESSGTMKGKAAKEISLSAADIAAKANNSAEISGATVDLKANGMLSAKAAGNTVIKGAMVQIN